MIEYSGNTAVVDAIEQGKIVRVPEEYARREGLLILRKSTPVSEQALGPKEKKDELGRKNKGFIGMDDLRKPLRPNQNELLKELIENFHWTLMEKRKARGLTRKKVAESIGETELNVKMIENGVLPMNNFILINKLESFYGVTLRKNRIASAGGKPLRQIIDFNKKEVANKSNTDEGDIIDLGRDSSKAGKKDNLDDEDFIDLTKL